MTNMKLAPLLIAVFIVPQIAFAAWWNPLSWDIFSFLFGYHSSEQVQTQTSTEVMGSTTESTRTEPSVSATSHAAPASSETKPAAEKPHSFFDNLPSLPKVSLPSFTPTTKPAPVEQPATTTQKEEPTSTTKTPADPVGVDAKLSSALKGAVVNIACTSHIPSVSSTSGSGVIIDKRGIILTVAHVAQMMLLEEYLGRDKVSCVIRTGSPARAAYLAKPIYVSNSWLTANAKNISTGESVPTGEHDVALLAITATAGGGVAPSSFPSMKLSDGGPSNNQPVTLGTYGAEGLSEKQISNSLYPTIATADVLKFYTFADSSPDGFFMTENPALQHGSSGGAVVDKYSEVVGIVTIAEYSGSINSNHLGGVTTSYIVREFERGTDRNFGSYLNGAPPSSLAKAYAATALSQGEDLAKANGIEK